MFLQKILAGTTYTAGTTKEAGLPNINYNGQKSKCQMYKYNYSGIFKYIEHAGHEKSGSDKSLGIFEVDLSGGNPIFGKSSTVQPEAIIMQYIIRYI